MNEQEIGIAAHMSIIGADNAYYIALQEAINRHAQAIIGDTRAFSVVTESVTSKNKWCLDELLRDALMAFYLPDSSERTNRLIACSVDIGKLLSSHLKSVATNSAASELIVCSPNW